VHPQQVEQLLARVAEVLAEAVVDGDTGGGRRTGTGRLTGAGLGLFMRIFGGGAFWRIPPPPPPPPGPGLTRNTRRAGSCLVMSVSVSRLSNPSELATTKSRTAATWSVLESTSGRPVRRRADEGGESSSRGPAGAAAAIAGAVESARTAATAAGSATNVPSTVGMIPAAI